MPSQSSFRRGFVLGIKGSKVIFLVRCDKYFIIFIMSSVISSDFYKSEI